MKENIAYQMVPFVPKAKWIWCENNKQKDDKVLFYHTFEISQLPDSCPCYLAVDTKYWLFINKQLVIFEGGLFRESLPGCGYADHIDLKPYLKPGKNELIVLCWYYGNEGRNNTDSTQAGFLLECQSLGLYSDRSFLSMRPDCFFSPDGSKPSYLYGGYDVGYDASKENFQIGEDFSISFKPEKNALRPSVEYPNLVWGELYERPIPSIRLSERKALSFTQEKELLTEIKLPYAMAFSPSFILTAEGGETVTLYTDRYEVSGGPGDTQNRYRGHKLQYRCRKGQNRFTSPFYLYGEKIYLSYSSSVKIREVAYLESGYDTEIVGTFTCDCAVTNRLVEKAARTLYVCMRDNYMDCPDRERGQWIGDVSVQAGQIGFLLDEKANLLTKKCIHDFLFLRKGDVLVGNVPGANFGELPPQSLNAISQVGLIAEYYQLTQDREVLEWALKPAVNYLRLWQMNEHGLICHREGNWGWFDHLYNIDKEVLENCWYYSALQFSKQMASILGVTDYDDFLQERIESIKQHFETRFWKGSYYASECFADDRANAMAVLSGLCPSKNFPYIRELLLSVFHATPYMENYILSALCSMGYIKDAYRRMVSRYYPLASNDNSTLWEDFSLLGTKNHAWSGAPATIAFRYFMGIKLINGLQEIKISPCKGLFSKMECTFPGKNGMIHLIYEDSPSHLTIDNQSESHILL